jgi:hypothetical protein
MSPIELYELNHDFSKVMPIKLRSIHLKARSADDCKKIAEDMIKDLDLKILDDYWTHFGKEGVGEFYFSRTTSRIELLKGVVYPEHRDRILKVAKKYGFR